jgi:hypothetical protein
VLPTIDLDGSQQPHDPEVASEGERELEVAGV